MLGYFKNLHNTSHQSTSMAVNERFDLPIFAMVAGNLGTEPKMLDEVLMNGTQPGSQK
jgi:hypothetical protein